MKGKIQFYLQVLRKWHFFKGFLSSVSPDTIYTRLTSVGMKLFAVILSFERLIRYDFLGNTAGQLF